jgi:hypothetical protein
LIFQYLLVPVVGLTLAFGYGNAIFGWSAKRAASALREILSPHIETLLARVLAVEDDAAEQTLDPQNEQEKS